MQKRLSGSINYLCSNCKLVENLQGGKSYNLCLIFHYCNKNRKTYRKLAVLQFYKLKSLDIFASKYVLKLYSKSYYAIINIHMMVWFNTNLSQFVQRTLCDGQNLGLIKLSGLSFNNNK